MSASITVQYERSDIQPGLQAYGLKITVKTAVSMPKAIFIFRRDVAPANVPATATEPDPSNPGIPPDTFICIADPVDLEEVPENIPDLQNEMPYYRLDVVQLYFRSPDLLEDTYNLVQADIQKLVDSINALGVVATTSEVTYD